MNNLTTNSVQHENEKPIDRLRDLKWSLTSIPSVDEAVLTHEDVDVEGDMVIRIDSEIVEPAIEDTIESYDAWMKPPKLYDHGTEVRVKMEDIPEPEFEESGQNNIRKRGGSHILAIPPNAIDESDIGLGDCVEFYSRDGEIRFRKKEN